MINTLKEYIRSTPLIIPHILFKGKLFKNLDAQNDESIIIDRLISRFNIPKVFVEFGFSGFEFNCIKLVDDWEGLLVDGHPYNIKIAKLLFPKKIEAKKMWIDLDSLDYIINYTKTRDLGILSIDVDGNDYWFLKTLLTETDPAIIIAEYNSSFGLRPLTVPYDPKFDRTKKHSSWLYYGASLSAINHLCAQNGYSLIEISNSGVNAFFIKTDLLTKDDLKLDPQYVFREKSFPDGARHSQQWEKIKHLPYVDVTK